MSVAEPLLQAALLGEAVDHAPVLVFVADESMRYLAVNQRACDVLGYTREELLALRVTDVATYPEAASDYGELQRERERRGVCELRRKDGTPVQYRYDASETEIAGMLFYVSVGTVE